MSAAQRVDWSVIEPHYRAGLRSLKDMGAEFGCSGPAILKHAKKEGWERDLTARIRAKADAKVSAAMVSAEVNETTKVTEALRVEVEAEVQARIRLTHRADIGKYRGLQMKLLTELEAMGDAKEGKEPTAARVKVLKDLTDVAKNLVALEREAYSLGDLPPVQDQTPAGEIDRMDVARRLAFLFAGASRTVQ